MSNQSRDRAAGKSCTIFSQGSSSYFRSFSLFYYPTYNKKMDPSNIEVHALLNFGASVKFMDKDFVNHHKLPLVTKKHPILVEVIDGRPLVSGDVTYETTALDIVIERHHSIIAFNIIKSSSNLVVLGLF